MGMMEMCLPKDTLLRVMLETIGLLTVWIVAGTLFYTYCDEDWTPLYAFFFSVNVGLGVGYGEFMPTRDTTKYFTSFYCMLGTSIAMGGLALFFEALTTRAKAATFTSPTLCSCCQGKFRMKWDDVRLAILFAAYAAAVAVGCWIGFEYEGYTDFADALLFSVRASPPPPPLLVAVARSPTERRKRAPTLPPDVPVSPTAESMRRASAGMEEQSERTRADWRWSTDGTRGMCSRVFGRGFAATPPPSPRAGSPTALALPLSHSSRRR